jgi:hypothetical protein
MAFSGQAETHVSIYCRFQGQALAGMTEAWSFPGVLRIHPEVDDVRYDLNVPLGLHVSSHDTEREERLAVLEDHRRHERMEWAFPWSEAVPVFRIAWWQAVQTIGLALVFFVINDTILVLVVTMVRVLGRFASFAIAGDPILLILSGVQALGFQFWRYAGREEEE